MSELQTSMPTTLVSSDTHQGFVRIAPAALRICLVVSASPQRSQILVRAAQEEHWATIVCRGADEAARQAVRNRIQLALVDMQSVPLVEERAFRTLVEHLAARNGPLVNGPLVAICGNPNDNLGEVWSRQLGVWMYLPGVDSESDLALVCSEARSIVEKLSGEKFCGDDPLSKQRPAGEKRFGQPREPAN
jgi:hypothetical protein